MSFSKNHYPAGLLLLLIYFTATVNIPAVDFKTIPQKRQAARLATTDPLQVVSLFQQNRPLNRAAQTPDTLSILALRVQFLKDSLKTTTGDGLFDLSSESEYIIDPPPHDKPYFEQQLLAVRNYFHTVSNGHLVLASTVYPAGLTEAYQLPNNMVYYSGEEDEEKQKQRWAELIRDAVTQANAADRIIWDDYDILMIFHAGVGKDFAFDFNETPFDIQSAFIDFETLKSTLGADATDYAGIEVNPGFYVREAIILPESQSQKGYSLGLLGTATLLMGSHLGMPSLFNTETGRAGIGKWGLMDQGSYNFYGLIPAFPDAWTRMFMGWDEPVKVNTMTQIRIGTTRTNEAPHLIKIPINSSEYFLIENRQEDWNGDGITYGRDEKGTRVKFDSLGNVTAEPGLGVITRIDEYDYGLPGSGILIWHIDERVIARNLASNTINNDPEHRGIDLIECDGPQDIGQVYAMFTPGYGAEAGDYWDPYWSGNISHQYVNGEKPVEFSSTSIPNSDAYGGAKTMIRLAEFSDNDTVMTFTATSNYFRQGFPQYAGGTFAVGALNQITTASGAEALLAVSQQGEIFAWYMDGNHVLDNQQTRIISDYKGNQKSLPAACVGNTQAPVHLSTVVYDFRPDIAGEEFAIVDEQGILSLWSLGNNPSQTTADNLLAIPLNVTPTSGPMVLIPATSTGSLAGTIVIGTKDGDIILVKADGSSLSIDLGSDAIKGMTVFNAMGAGIAAVTASGRVAFYQVSESGSVQLIEESRATGQGESFSILSTQNVNHEDIFYVISQDGRVTILNLRGRTSAVSLSSAFSPIGAPAFGDIDLDGIGEVLFHDSHRFGAVKESGAGVLNFPVSYAQEQGSLSFHLTSPLWMLADDNAYAFVADPRGFIFSYDAKGKMATGFPLTIGAEISATPVLYQNPDKTLTIFTLANDGFLYAWNTGLSIADDVLWPRFGGNRVNSFAGSFSLPSVAPSPVIMPQNLVFCYPNPSTENRTFIRYTLNHQVESMNIRIFDIAGSLVAEFVNNPVSSGDHEVMWDVAAVQSGAYIARVEAIYGHESLVKFVKIAVVK